MELQQPDSSGAPAPSQGPAPQPGPQDPYQFIMEPPKKAKPGSGRMTAVTGNPFIMKIAFLVGGALVLMIAAAVAVNVFFGSKTNTQALTDLTLTEQELIRVAGLANKATDQSIKNAAITTQVVVSSQQQQWVTFLKQHGQTVDPVALAPKGNTATDQRLKQAEQTSTFNTAYVHIMRTQLVAYGTALKNAYDNAVGDEKALLAQDYNEVALLLEQWPDGEQ